jgi:hypothetical protein
MEQMPNYTASTAASAAVVNYDILTGERWNRSPVHRQLVALGLAGSAAIGDTQVDFYIDEVRVAGLFNTATGFPQVNRDMQPMGGLFIPAGAQLSGIVIDAAATNPINATLSIEDLV